MKKDSLVSAYLIINPKGQQTQKLVAEAALLVLVGCLLDMCNLIYCK
jgi:hypothetical protein